MTQKFRLPVVSWTNHLGLVSGCLLDCPSQSAAAGASIEVVLDQLRDYAEWHCQEYPWFAMTDFNEPQLTSIKVDLRPEYHENDRVFPCPESLLLRFPCVWGKQETNLFCCVLPTLGIRFDFYSPQELSKLASHFVKNELQGISPQALLRRLPPREVQLHEITLKSTFDQKSAAWFNTEEIPALAAIAEPLTGPGAAAQRAGVAWGRAAQVAQLLAKLEQEKAQVILVGEPGSGKSTILLEAARKLARSHSRPEDANDDKVRVCRLWQTNADRLIAGMRYLGQWEERCETVIDELSRISGILCIENLLDLARTGGQGPVDSLAAFFLPYLQRGELRMVAEATPSELDACRRLLPGFAEAFQIVPVPDFAGQDALDAIQHVLQAREQGSQFQAGREVGPLVFHLFKRFLPYHSFPGKAAAFVHRLADEVAQKNERTLSTAQVYDQFIRQTGLPELFLRHDLVLSFDEVAHHFQQRIIGQPAACRAAANLVTTFKAGLSDPARPLGVLLFSGPTGVGKTALAKAIADYFFGHGEMRERLVRLDMSEYSTPWSVDRLLKSPEGGPGNLIKRLRQQPFSVVLLDEIEKAAPEVFDLFLNVFDEGRLTDPLGRLTTFRSAVIIMTSNLGSDKSGAIGFTERDTTAGESEFMSFFRPEFYNRLDAVVPFDPLSDSAILAITRKEMGEISLREGLAKARVRLSWNEALIDHLAKIGFDRRLGARPLQRALEQTVVAPLARFLVDNPRLNHGEIHLAWQLGSLVIQPRA